MRAMTFFGVLALAAVSAAGAAEGLTIPARRAASATAAPATESVAQPAGGSRAPVPAGKRLAPAPLARLEPSASAAAGELDALELANVSGGRPWQIGFTRSLSGAGPRRPFTLSDFTAEAASGGGTTWVAQYEIAGAYLTRAHLEKVSLPPGARVYTYGADGVPQGPVGAAQIGEDGDLWLPSAAGDRVWIEIQAPAPSSASPRLSLETARGAKDPGGARESASSARPRFEFSEVNEIVRLDAQGRPLRFSSAPANAILPCLVDISCVTPTADITNASAAIGSYGFVHKKKSFVCTGGLLNDLGSSGQEYFLTANHCLSTSKDVATMETWWDYRSSVCDGLGPVPSAVQKTFGASLLATDATTDFTFVRVHGVPAGRFFFGSTTGGPGAATIGRVSNPGGGLQTYSETMDNGAGSGSCQGLPPGDFLYQTQLNGAISGGSSGAPSWIAGGIVVGQLFGLCGPRPNDDCDAANNVVDGAFSETGPSIAAWLSDPTGTPSAPSGLQASKLSKKKVTLNWTDTSAIEERYDLLEFDGLNWNTIGTLPMDTGSAKVKGLQGGQMYTLGVQACLGSACSAIEQILVLTP